MDIPDNWEQKKSPCLQVEKPSLIISRFLCLSVCQSFHLSILLLPLHSNKHSGRRGRGPTKGFTKETVKATKREGKATKGIGKGGIKGIGKGDTKGLGKGGTKCLEKGVARGSPSWEEHQGS